MSTSYHIDDVALPVSQDFQLLKSEGMACIQLYMGNEWTNLNPSDPGITILDQLCYALTELGYCNNFSIADILTRSDGSLETQNQFYLPEQILTSSPVTIDDYRKYMIDGIEGVDNAIIAQVTDAASGVDTTYQAYLLIDLSKYTGKAVDDICKMAFFYLNKCRNIGDIFLTPLPLIKKEYCISGSIEIETAISLNKILSAIQDAIQQYIFPKVSPEGYDVLVADGMETNEIFNGPLLNNGWIPSASLGEIKSELRSMELVQVIQSIPGVVSASDISFINETPAVVSAKTNEIIFIDIFKSVKITGGKRLDITCKGKHLSLSAMAKPDFLSATSSGSSANILFGASVNMQTELPQGKFRDINTYYSIQNTFPEIFSVGPDAIVTNASDFQIAQSRQLKGYLTLFDQVLANQFSQLANIDKLFSFKNSLSGAPSEQVAYYAVKDAYEKKHSAYPVPYLSFSPTYFYQALYDVPNIRPLLKDNETLAISRDFESDDALAYQSWVAYKLDPYNAYIRGLMHCMENEKINLERRNDILDHLLARHGESPLVMDTIIQGSIYAGDALKDKVIFKSLYLQNLGLLSYNRQKAYNFIGAKKITIDDDLDLDTFKKQIIEEDTRDFIFNSEKIDRREQLTEQDVINYSGIELKMSLLFGLNPAYRDFIKNSTVIDASTGDDDHKNTDQIKAAMWMIRQRRGVIMIETSLLRQSLYAWDGTETTTGGKAGGQDPGNDIVLIFPDFIPQLNTPEFKDRVNFFLENELPVMVTPACKYVGIEELKKLMSLFADWHNSLVFYNKDSMFHKWLIGSATALLDELANINT